LIFEKLINYDNIRLIKETDINQSQISLLPWIGNFTQSFLHSPNYKFLSSLFLFYQIYISLTNINLLINKKNTIKDVIIKYISYGVFFYFNNFL